MNRYGPLARLALFLVLAIALGYVVEQTPGRLTLSIPEEGITVSVPQNLEGWSLEPGEGDLLVRGRTRGGLMNLEVVKVPVPENGDIDGFIVERHKQLREGKEQYIVWHQGPDTKFGRRSAPAYKATYQGTILGWLPTEIWQYDSYWPYRGGYVRISMSYPDFMANYFYPDRALIGAGLKLEQ